jgi:P27 family predicted phage terminase small subunit
VRESDRVWPTLTGMRGRVPRSRDEQVREGVRADRLPEVVRVSPRLEPGERLPAPMELGRDALAFYDDVQVALIEAGVIERIDRYLLALTAEAWGTAVKASRVLAEVGQYTLGSQNQVVVHPAVKIQRDAIQLFERLSQSLCLSPVARARLGLAALTGQLMSHELDELLAPADAIDAEAIDVGIDGVGLPGCE